MPQLPPTRMSPADEAYRQFLINQAQFFLTQTRTLKVSMLCAISNGELSPETLSTLYNEFLQMAGLCETK